MCRRCVRYYVDEFLQLPGHIDPAILNSNVEIWMDIEKSKQREVIHDFIKNRKEWFARVLSIAMKGKESYNDDFYRKERLSQKAKDVCAMRFTKGKDNVRIYCKEYLTGDSKKIVMICLLKKKDLNKKLKRRIETIGGYRHVFE